MYNIYKVEKEETLEEISKKFNTSITNLKRINGIQDNMNTFEGKYIIVPAKNNKLFDVYTIQEGDTIYGLSKKYDIDEDLLLELNGLLKTDYIYPNEDLLIPLPGVEAYITKNGDTLSLVSEKLKTNVANLILQNEKIFLLPEQLIVSKIN